MVLEKYKNKRKFNKTPEPKGRVKRGRGKRFVVHKHQARSLHYDFRLEMDGVLKSWAVPKQPPLKKGIKRLAVQVEDHPVDYIDFSGVIPKGNYGAGKVEIWDEGVYQEIIKSRNHKIKNADAFKFELVGEKMAGEYALVRMKENPSTHSGRGNWLLFKTR